MEAHAPPKSLPLPRAPRRWPRRLLACAGLLVLAVLLAPFYVDPLVRGLVVRRLEHDLGARVSVRDLDLSWPARVRLLGLEVKDASGAPLASVQEASASLAVGALLRGRVQARAEVLYPEVHLRQDPAEGWNWAPVVAHLEGLDEEASSGADGTGVPDLQLDLKLQEGRLIFHGPGGDSRVEGLSVRLEVDDLGTPAPFEVAWRLRGPGGPGGSGRIAGSIVAAPGGRLDPLEATGNARVELTRVDLAALTPALSGVLPARSLAGIASGTVEMQLGSGLALVGRSDLELLEARVSGPLPDAPPAVVGSLRISGLAEVAGDGSGTQHLELRADDFLAIVLDGTTRVDDGGGTRLESQVSLAGDLAGLVRVARSWVPFQPGVQLGGRLEETLVLTAELDSRRPRSVRLEARGGLQGVTAVDARGRTLDLAALANVGVELRAEADLERNTLVVPALRVALGPVELQAEGSLAGLTAEPHLDSGRARIVADLERLRGTLEQLVALPPDAFGGHVEAEGDLSGSAAALDFRGELNGRDLIGGGLQLSSVRGSLSGRWAPDGPSHAGGDLSLGALTLELPDGPALTWPGLRLEAGATREESGHLTLEGHLTSPDGAVEAGLAGEGTLSAELRGEVALHPTWKLALAAVTPPLSGLVPALADLRGLLEGSGDLNLALEAEGTRLVGSLSSRLEGLRVPVRGDEVLSVPGASDVTTGLKLAFALPAGVLEVEQATLECEALRARASGRFAVLSTDASAIESARLGLETDLEALGPALGVLFDLKGARLGGGALRAEAELIARGQAFGVRGHGTVAEAIWSTDGEAPLVQRDVHATFDLEVDPTAGTLVARALELGSTTLEAEVRGRLDGLADPETAQGELHLSLDGELERLLTDLALEPPGTGRRTQGRLHSRTSLAGSRGQFRLEGTSTIEGFRLEVPAEAPDEAPLVVAEPRIELGLAANLTLPALDVVVDRASLAAGLARGGAGGRLPALRPWLLGEEGAELVLEDWTGELVYVPERLGAVLGPWLPGRLEGSEERRVTLVLDGRARDLDLVTLLGGSRGHVDLALGRLVRPEIQVEGDLGLDLVDGRTKVRGDLKANGGTLSLDGDLAVEGVPEGASASKVTVEVRDLGLNAGLAPLLALVHPAFGSLDVAHGQLGGVAGLSLHLDYDRPIPAGALGGDWTALPLAPLHGSGRLEVREASLQGSPLMRALGELGLDVNRSLNVRPIEFTIERGRLSYARPWTWTLAGTETTFTGSVGLDRSVDLVWNVPVTEALVDRWGFLKAMLGESIAIPIGGTATRPRVDVGAVLTGIGRDLARREIGSAVGLGGDPARLLSEADQLWKQGKRAEAVPLYQRLRDEFKLSLVYVLNKDRIKERASAPK
jgi:hypothetical protein